MKLAIIGSRTFNDWDRVLEVFTQKFLGKVTCIISGGARGADLFGKRIAEHFNLEYIEHLPDWKTFGKSAGFVRNHYIIDESDMVLAFWDGISKGTKNSIDIAIKQNKRVFIERF